MTRDRTKECLFLCIVLLVCLLLFVQQRAAVQFETVEKSSFKAWSLAEKERIRADYAIQHISVLKKANAQLTAENERLRQASGGRQTPGTDAKRPAQE
jgi:hypothetical protein